MVGERGESAGQHVERQMRLGRIRLLLGSQGEKGAKLGDDVVQGHGLEGSATPERLVIGGQRLLGGFSVPRELVDESLPVEVFDRGHTGGVGVRPQIAPADELVEHAGDGIQLGATDVRRQCGVHVLGP